jgi:Zn-dependent protease
MIGNIEPVQIIAIIFVVFFGIGLHEYAHCKFADMAGDPTPGIYGRVTLNLTKHFELYGTLMMLITAVTGFGIGWGKPAPMDERRMRNPRWDLFAAVAAGPVSNLVQAMIYGFVAQAMYKSGQWTPADIAYAMGGRTENFFAAIVGYGVFLNLSLAFFNLIPIAPLDGHWLVGQLLPERPRAKWYLYSRRYGFMVLLVVIIGGQLANYSIVGKITAPFIFPLVRILLNFPV